MDILLFYIMLSMYSYLVAVAYFPCRASAVLWEAMQIHAILAEKLTAILNEVII